MLYYVVKRLNVLMIFELLKKINAVLLIVQYIHLIKEVNRYLEIYFFLYSVATVINKNIFIEINNVLL